MKKNIIGSITTTIFLFSYFCSIFLSYTFIYNEWIAFGIGTGILALSIILIIVLSLKKLHIKKELAILFLVFNGIGSGLMVVSIMLGCEFIYTQNDLLINLGASILVCIATYLVYISLLNIKLFERHLKIYTFSFYILMIVVFFILLIFTSIWLFTGIAYFLMLFMIFALIIPTENENEAWSNFYYSSIGAFAVVSIIALMVLAGDGDIGDGLSELIPDVPENPNKKKYSNG